MDAARRLLSDYDHRSDPTPVLRPEEFANILRLRPHGDWQQPISRERPVALTASDIASALELVQNAAASMRDADLRVRDSEARTHALLQRAAEELKSAEARAEAAEGRARAAEARLKDAQSRAEEAENWLRQIFATISEELPARD